MSVETVAVTGGNGFLGAAILEAITDHGYRSVNLARGKQREDVSGAYYTTNLLDAGEVYGALARSDADAVIHMGSIPTPQTHPGFRTYESNVMSGYNILEAATQLELDSICLASSINAVGGTFQEAPMEVSVLPIDEAHPQTPRDPYSLAKHALEVTADGFGRKADSPAISSIRYPAVMDEAVLSEITGPEFSLEELETDESWLREELFTYLHLEDATSIARKAIEASHDGHERFWAVAKDTRVTQPTAEIAEAIYPDAEIRDPFEGTEGLIDISKAKRLLDWEPTHSWRDFD